MAQACSTAATRCKRVGLLSGGQVLLGSHFYMEDPIEEELSGAAEKLEAMVERNA
jgi:hypothetical protein